MRRRRSSRSKQSGLHLIARQLQDPTELCVLRRQVLGKDVLVSDLDPPHVAWLWEIMADSHKPRRVCRCLLLSHHNQPVGWVIYCVHSDQHAKIVEFGCQPQHTEAVLSEFLEYAIEKGLHAVRGDCSTPELTLAVVSQGARLHFEPSGCVFHWKDQQIGTALTSGDAFWSELDGEGWISMQGR